MRHPYHILSPSPWPLLISFNILFSLISFIGYFYGNKLSKILIIVSVLMVMYILYLWLCDIIIESYYLGFHTNIVSKSLIIGFSILLITEVMLFFSFFIGYFHSALNPYNLVWPPIGIELVNPWAIPLLNTFLLLYSGIIATYAHHSLNIYNRKNCLFSISTLVVLGICFFLLQCVEYLNSSFDISDSVYSSSFYMLTGLHSIHIIIGIIFFIVTFIRLYYFQFSNLLFDFAVLYWHFVDIVWIGLFILIYYMAY